MSFSTKQHKYVLDARNVKDPLWQRYAFLIIGNLLSKMKSFEDDMATHFSFYIEAQNRGLQVFTERNPSTGDYIHHLHCIKVTTSGPMVGFLGAYLDLDSGWWLLSDSKTTEAIGLYNFYGLLETATGVAINPKIAKGYIELFKLNQLSLEELLSSILEKSERANPQDLQGSKIRGLLGKKQAVGSESVKLSPENIESLAETLRLFLRKYLILLSSSMAIYPGPHKQSPQTTGIANFLTHLTAAFTPEEGSDSDDPSDLMPDLFPQMLSAPEIFQMSYFSPGKSGKEADLTNSIPHLGGHSNLKSTSTEILAMNYLDLIEDTDIEDELVMAVDDFRAQGTSKKALFDAVVERTGVGEVLKGTELSSMKKGLKRERVSTTFSNMHPDASLYATRYKYPQQREGLKDVAGYLRFWSRAAMAFGRIYKRVATVYGT